MFVEKLDIKKGTAGFPGRAEGMNRDLNLGKHIIGFSEYNSIELGWSGEVCNCDLGEKLWG